MGIGRYGFRAHLQLNYFYDTAMKTIDVDICKTCCWWRQPWASPSIQCTAHHLYKLRESRKSKLFHSKTKSQNESLIDRMHRVQVKSEAKEMTTTTATSKMPYDIRTPPHPHPHPQPTTEPDSAVRIRIHIVKSHLGLVSNIWFGDLS